MVKFAVIFHNEQQVTVYNGKVSETFPVVCEHVGRETQGEYVRQVYELDNQENYYVRNIRNGELLNNSINEDAVNECIKFELSDPLNKFTRYAYEKFEDRFDSQANRVLIIDILPDYKNSTLKTPEELEVDQIIIGKVSLCLYDDYWLSYCEREGVPLDIYDCGEQFNAQTRKKYKIKELYVERGFNPDQIFDLSVIETFGCSDDFKQYNELTNCSKLFVTTKCVQENYRQIISMTSLKYLHVIDNFSEKGSTPVFEALKFRRPDIIIEAPYNYSETPAKLIDVPQPRDFEVNESGPLVGTYNATRIKEGQVSLGYPELFHVDIQIKTTSRAKSARFVQ